MPSSAIHNVSHVCFVVVVVVQPQTMYIHHLAMYLQMHSVGRLRPGRFGNVLGRLRLHSFSVLS